MCKLNFTNITVIPGKNNSKFPYCNSLLLDGGDTIALVETGAGPENITAALGTRQVDLVINTHYHFDHIYGNYYFPRADIYLNPIEASCFPDLAKIGEWLGIKEIYGDKGVRDWIEKVSKPNSPQAQYSPCYRHEWWLSTRIPARQYEYDRVWQIGKVRVVMIHTPGHTRGFCCPYFPDEGLVYTGDIDLTGFGPWYAGSDGGIEDFINSAKKIAELDADWFLTGHQEGLLTRSDFRSRLDKYLNVIYKRHERIVSLFKSGVEPGEIPKHGLFYPAKYQVDPWLAMWEKITIRKHLELMDKI